MVLGVRLSIALNVFYNANLHSLDVETDIKFFFAFLCYLSLE